MSTAHPPQRIVPLSTGKKIKVRTWTMAQRAELRPKIVALLERFTEIDLGADITALGSALIPLFIQAEDEVVEIVRDSIPRDVLSDEEWGAMAWTEDLPLLAQAIWELHFSSSQGIVGKVMGGLASQIAARRAARPPAGPNGSQSPTPLRPTQSKPGDSVSSLDGGGPIPSA